MFQQPGHVFQPGKYPETWLTFGEENSNIPLAIHVSDSCILLLEIEVEITKTLDGKSINIMFEQGMVLD